MDKEERRKLGAKIGAVGLLILAVNLIDFFAGWNRIADELALLGLALAIAGAIMVDIFPREKLAR